MAKVLVKASKFSPDFIVIMADPKVGKTSIALQLQDSLLVDMQSGALSYDGYKVQATTMAEIKAICKQNRETGDYKVVVFDTLKELLDACMPGAVEKYRKTVAGSKFNGGVEDLLQVPYGAGTTFLEKEFMELLEDELRPSFEKIILLGHTKSSSSIEDNVELNVKSIDTVGKIRNVVTRLSDAIASMSRKGNKAYLNFSNDEGVQAGSRYDHLTNKKILISEKSGRDIQTHWDMVFPELYGKTVEEIMTVKNEPSEPAEASAKATKPTKSLSI